MGPQSVIGMVRVGGLDLLDLDLAGERQGRDMLPYPFRYTHPTRFQYADEVESYSATVPERLRTGDLAVFARYLHTLWHSDIEVSCHVQQMRADVESVRALAVRSGQQGFLAVQRNDVDVIDIHSVSPYDLGAAIAEAAGLQKPGRHRRIVVPELNRNGAEPADGNDSSVVIRQSAAQTTDVSVPLSTVEAYATVQSRWEPARRWGPDRSKPMLIWLRVGGDGDYVYTDEGPHAIPLSWDSLQERIDRLISADISLLREARGVRSEASWA